MREKDSPGRKWVEAAQDINRMCGALLGVIHPNLHKAGCEAFEKMLNNPTTVKNPETVVEALEHWTTPFSGISIVSNRETPIHRDINGRNTWYDILATFGDYENGRLELPGLGYRLKYDPGTIVGIAGKVVCHGVPRVDGNRVCIAYYMRNKVHEWLKIRSPDWSNLENWKF